MSSYQHYVLSLPHTSTEFVPIVVPDIDCRGESMTLCNWLIESGERVEQGEDVLEISLPGIVYDVPAPASGRLECTARAVSEPVQPGDICGWIRLVTDPPTDEVRRPQHDAARSDS